MKSSELHKRWLGKLTRLHPATGRGACHGVAPHKPLLLLAVLDLVENGELTTPTLTRTAGLVLRFRSYGTIVAERWPTRLDMTLPFYHLHSQGFWQPLDSEMRPAKSAGTCAVCELAPEFYALLANPEFRAQARLLLVTRYFTPTERIGLFESLGLRAGTDRDTAATNVVREAAAAAKSKGRCARFAVRVVAEYRYTCALTGYSCVTQDGATVVDAAHIEQWARTRNDELVNGLALSKTAHWMFDEGLWSADNNLRVIVNSRRFCEAGPEALQLAAVAGRPLQFDPRATLRPAIEYLRRHRVHHGWRL